MKNIIHISRLDYGGAAIAAYRFHKNIQNAGQNSLFFVSVKTKEDDSVIALEANLIIKLLLKVVNRIEMKFRLFKSKYYFYDKGRSQYYGLAEELRKLKFIPDVIVLHSLSGFISLSEIEKVASHYGCKVFWYLMDMGPMTGGCHYAWDCEGYVIGCKKCPAVPFYLNNRPFRNLKKKLFFVKETKTLAISCSVHLTNQLRKSSVFKNADILDLMLGIDPVLFNPVVDSHLRSSYGVPDNKRVLFIGASNINEERKGFNYIFEALKIFKQNWPEQSQDLFLLVAGNADGCVVIDSIGLAGKYIGFLKGDKKLAEAYQVSDFFVSASIEDTGPMMINESLMAGTPIISFRMGVAEDLVINHRTGYLARLKDVDDLAKGIYELVSMSDFELNEMKARCRKFAIEKTSIDVQINGFLQEIE
jgi:glycosyltransferase involved in cell wall biosynthesis